MSQLPIQNTVLITSDTNPSRVEMMKQLSGVDRIALRVFRLSLPDFTGTLPKFLYLRANIPCFNSGTEIIKNANSSLRIPSDAIPVHFRPNPTIFTGALSQYPVFWGFQDAVCNFKMKNVGNLTVFDLELYDDTGKLVVFPAGSQVEYTFSVEYTPSKYTVDTTTVQGIRRINDFLNA